MTTPTPPMASPANFEVTRSFGVGVHNSKFKFSKLYMRQIFSGPDTNQSDVIVANTATGLGQTSVNDWAIYDGLGSLATLVARGQGMHTFAANWQNWFTIVFEDQRFKGSTLQIMGASMKEPDEWAIVGGTGDFAMAQGVIQRNHYQDASGETIHEITIDGYCRMNLPPVATPTKSGPWGGKGIDIYEIYEMTEKSQRLESLTLRHSDIVQAITFSYFNEAGQLRTAGRWGPHNAGNIREETINFGPSEVVTGITGATIISQYVGNFKIVTNVKTYGPFGTRADGPSFSFNVPVDKTLVGFFGTGVNSYINKIGVYTI